MTKIGKFLQIFLIALFSFSQVAFTGPNENASVYLDYDFRTAGVETSCDAIMPGDTCYIAVYVTNAVNLNCYSMKIGYDSSVVHFCTASEKISFTQKPFLESASGKMIFISKNYGNEIEIAATIQGKETTVSGNGCIGYLIFKCALNGNPEFTITEAKLVDDKSKIDQVK